MSAPVDTLITDGERAALAYYKAHPEAVADVISRIPKRDRCYASVALGALGLGLAIGGAFGWVSLDVGALGGTMAASSSALIAQFCGK